MTGDAGTEKPAYRAGFFVSGICPHCPVKACNTPIIPTRSPSLDWTLPASQLKVDDRSVVMELIKKNQ
jgi:hypothetical protein